MTTFHDRRSGSMTDPLEGYDFAPTREEKLHSLYGSGEAGLHRLFGGGPKAPVPWGQAGKSRSRSYYDPEIVRHELSRPPSQLTPVDPRHLLATQPSLVRAGVAHYMSNQFRQGGPTFADQHNVGNQHPFVYAREKDGGHENILLAGHHRAATALLRGEPLYARHVSGGWGPER